MGNGGTLAGYFDGLSHNEAEEITKEWANAGANVLMHAILQLAELSE